MGCHMGPTEKKLDLWVALKCYTLKLWKVLMSKLLGTQSVIEQQFFPEQVNLPTEIAGAYLLSLADFDVQPESKVPGWLRQDTVPLPDAAESPEWWL